MPVYKFKTFEEAEKALWNFEPDEAYYKRVWDMFAFVEQFYKYKFPRGIYKYKTIEEANRDKQLKTGL